MGVPLYFIHFKLGFSLTIQLLGYPHVRKPLYLWFSYIYCYYCFYSYYYWLVVLTILKNVSQWEGWHPIYDMEKMFQTTKQFLLMQVKSQVLWCCDVPCVPYIYSIWYMYTLLFWVPHLWIAQHSHLADPKFHRVAGFRPDVWAEIFLGLLMVSRVTGFFFRC